MRPPSNWPPLALLAAVAPAVVLLPTGPRAAQEVEGRLLDPAIHHLGDGKEPGWQEASADPEPSPLTVRFESIANPVDWLLFVSSRDVDHECWLELNGVRLARLIRQKALTEQRIIVPAGALATGVNELRVAPADPRDDFAVGRVRLVERSLRDVLGLGRVEITVTDAADGSPLPARITFARPDGTAPELWYADERSTAVRPGIAYTSNGRAVVELLPGRVTVWAGRGMEWGVASAEVDVAAGAAARAEFALSREVDTAGWIACDTHIHTLTHSGHGDSSMEERMVTIAGEGIELPIATDHNKQIDYRPMQEAMRVSSWFTAVTGNEVTTENGHMNAFPLPPGNELPPWRETDWEKLVAGIRAKGAQVVILNHPRWPENGKDPWTRFGLDDATGERRAPQRFTFDCIELINSDGPTAPPEMVLPGWFGLLNRGQRFTAIGSSDSHHVGVIVGQGRTYVPSATDDPSRIDVAAVCRAFKEGRVSASYGLFATIDVAGRGMGDLVQVDEESAVATVRVRHPSWLAPERLDLVVDGTVVATVPLAPSQAGDTPTEAVRRVSVTLPGHDSWLVAVASAPALKAPFWNMQLPRALGVTNPVLIDRDGDDRWSSPRSTAERLLGAARDDGALARVRELLPELDDGAALQLLELSRDRVDAAGRARLAESARGSGRATLAEWSARTLTSP
jgi:hypothetical protein